MTLWDERAARNEALFREVNEQIAGLANPSTRNSEIGFVCECSDESCTERVFVPIAAYEAVRAGARTFVVLPGHEGAFERVVERSPRYTVVEKEETAGRIAEQTDPRA
jgi:hypothetical protein